MENWAYVTVASLGSFSNFSDFLDTKHLIKLSSRTFISWGAAFINQLLTHFVVLCPNFVS